MQAIRYIKGAPNSYDKDDVAALAASICILPPGSCVDLNSGEKALVIEENPEDFTRPLLLVFSDNELYDLRKNGAKPGIHVKDVMKTMDNRIVMDEETLKQFIADEPLKETAERFRRKKRRQIIRAKARN